MVGCMGVLRGKCLAYIQSYVELKLGAQYQTGDNLVLANFATNSMLCHNGIVHGKCMAYTRSYLELKRGVQYRTGDYLKVVVVWV
jgi:hypothetical protein